MPSSLPIAVLNGTRAGYAAPRYRRGIHNKSRAAAQGQPAPAAAGTCPSVLNTPVRRHQGLLTWAVSIFLALQIGSTFFIVPQGATVNVVRIAGLLVLTPFAWQQTGASEPADTSNRIFLARDLAVFKRFLVGYVLWALSSTLLHGDLGQFLTHIGGAIFLLIVVRVLASDGGATVARVLPLVLGFAVAMSIGMGLLDPTQGLAAGRLRGVFVNANLLGFYAFVTLIAGLLLVRTEFWSVALCALSISAIVWTGSRTSAIAAVSAVLLLAAFGNRRSRWISWGMVGLAAAALAGLIDPSASLPLRSLDTRDGSFEEVVRVASVSPQFGLGVGGELVEVASTPLRAFAEGGVVGLLGVIIMYVVLLREAIRRNTLLFAVSIAAILSSFGEGWFLSSLGSMMLVFVSVWVGVSSEFASAPNDACGEGVNRGSRPRLVAERAGIVIGTPNEGKTRSLPSVSR